MKKISLKKFEFLQDEEFTVGDKIFQCKLYNYKDYILRIMHINNDFNFVVGYELFLKDKFITGTVLNSDFAYFKKTINEFLKNDLPKVKVG